MKDTEREAETQAEGEAGSMQELDPGFPGSHSGLKAGTKLLSHPRIPIYEILRKLDHRETITPSITFSNKRCCVQYSTFPVGYQVMEFGPR